MGKDNFTSDGKHLQFSETDNLPLPDNFGPTGDAAICPQPFGRVIEEGTEEGYIAPNDSSY